MSGLQSNQTNPEQKDCLSWMSAAGSSLTNLGSLVIEKSLKDSSVAWV
jgi:hypothetical protein